MIVIDSVYINLSGGKTLLETFLRKVLIENSEKKFYFIFDKRIKIDLDIDLSKINFEFMDNTENARKKFYKENKIKIKTIFCFGNVPPPITIVNSKVYILFHNTLLISSNNISIKKIKSTILFYIKRIYIKFKNNKNYFWIVQTPTVKNSFKKKMGVADEKVYILPFYNNDWPTKINKQLDINKKNILYVADGSPQKNHFKLFEAIEKLPKQLSENLNFYFTIPDNFKNIIVELDILRKKGYNINNYGICSKNELELLYEKCNYMIFPSLSESFGLPLLEAAKAKCKIIASDLPYVYDIVIPTAVFDPNDSMLISKAIQDCLANNNNQQSELLISNQINEIYNLMLC